MRFLGHLRAGSLPLKIGEPINPRDIVPAEARTATPPSWFGKCSDPDNCPICCPPERFEELMGKRARPPAEWPAPPLHPITATQIADALVGYLVVNANAQPHGGELELFMQSAGQPDITVRVDRHGRWTLDVSDDNGTLSVPVSDDA